MERYVSFLVDLLERARVRLLREWRGERGVVGVNVKGDETRGFDFRVEEYLVREIRGCLLYTSPSPRDLSTSRMPSSA